MSERAMSEAASLMDTVKWAVKGLLSNPDEQRDLLTIGQIQCATFAPGSRGEALVGFAIKALRDEGAIRFCPDTGWGLPCKYADKGCTAPEWRGQPEHNKGCCVECGAEA